MYPYSQIQAIHETHRSRATGWTLKTLEQGGYGFIYSPAILVVVKEIFAQLLLN